MYYASWSRDEGQVNKTFHSVQLNVRHCHSIYIKVLWLLRSSYTVKPMHFIPAVLLVLSYLNFPYKIYIWQCKCRQQTCTVQTNISKTAYWPALSKFAGHKCNLGPSTYTKTVSYKRHYHRWTENSDDRQRMERNGKQSRDHVKSELLASLELVLNWSSSSLKSWSRSTFDFFGWSPPGDGWLSEEESRTMSGLLEIIRWMNKRLWQPLHFQTRSSPQ